MTISSEAREAFEERFESVIRGDDDIPTYWQDDLSELADSLVPVYTADMAREWLDAGCPDIDDEGLIEGVTDVSQIIGTVLYERYLWALYSVADEHGFN